MAKKKKPSSNWTESRIADAVQRSLFPPPAYAFLRGVRDGTGYGATRTADAVAASLWPSRGLALIGIEIKVSASDWRRELKAPEKAAAMHPYCREWYVAAPAGIIPVDQLPPHWGLIECSRSAKVVKASRVEDNPRPPDLSLVCSILRNVAKRHEIDMRCVVPKSELEAERQAIVKDAHHSIGSQYQQQLETLKTTIREFEAASGVKLDQRWQLGYIGEAVKFIRTNGIDGYRKKLEAMSQHAEGIAASLKQAVSSLPKEETSAQ